MDVKSHKKGMFPTQHFQFYEFSLRKSSHKFSNVDVQKMFIKALDIILKNFLSTLKVYKSNYLIGDVNKNDELNTSFLKKSHTTIGIIH